MTKSIKEKTRQQKIREHLLNGSPVPNELLKIKISYDKKNFYKYLSSFRSSSFVSINNYKKKLTGEQLSLVETIYNPNWLKRNLNTNLKEIIRFKISDIANNLKIYELKFQVQFLVEKINNFELDFNCILKILIKDTKNNFIGFLIFEDLPCNNYNNYNIRDIIKIQSSRNVEFIKNPSPILNIMFENLKKSNFSMQFNRHYKFRNVKNQELKNEIKKIHKTVWDVSKYIKNINKFSFNITINKNIRYSQVHYFSSAERTIWYLYIYSKCYELDIIRHFVELGELDIGVPEEHLVIENIDYIRTMIKLLKY